MKKAIHFSFFLLLLHSSLFAFAEGDTASSSKLEIGVNGTEFIKQFASFNEFTFSSDPYLITLKYGKKSKLRFGIGADYSSTQDNTETGSSQPGQSPPAANTSSSDFKLDFRAGYEWQKNLSKRFDYYYGLDLIHALSLTEARSSSGVPIQQNGVTTFVESSSEQKGSVISLGLAPVLGIQFRVTPRIYLYTEASIRLMHSEKRSELETNSFTQSTVFTSGNSTNVLTPLKQTSTDSGSSNDMKFVVPNAIYVSFKF